MAQVFNVQVFFVVFRESLEAVIVISVLLSFIKQSLGKHDPALKKKLYKQVWIGSALGFLICLILGGAFIGAFYGLGRDVWGSSEDIWEGVFCLIATILITAMGIPMLRINKMQEKWRIKLAQSLVKKPKNKRDRFKLGHLTKKYSLFILPFITVLREGIEAIVFVGGVSINGSATAFPLPVVIGLIAGIAVGVVLYYFGSSISLQIFLIISTCILYLIAAGLFSRGVWYFQNYKYAQATGGDAAENGSGPGTYDINQSVWHVNCCNPMTDHGWDVFNALLGWQNSATYGSVISYNVYWLVLIIVLLLMIYEEKHGHLPFTKNFTFRKMNPMYYIKGEKNPELKKAEREALFAQLEEQRFGDVEEVPEGSSSAGHSTEKVALQK
ncbi:Plasma membrane iron permease [Candida viswanathii]|uniref:Plasma membrane iron permease n=1 Tax=Candida viswanathii TaxID=5486 RepID=A0A367YF24_9ASCO|nr:Plasma membrane iron permease [Candida viswanathii]